MMLTLILSAALQLVPAPVEYTPAEGPSVQLCEQVRLNKKAFRKAVAQLEPWQQQEAYRITIGKTLRIEALTREGLFRARKTLEQLQAQGPLPCGVLFDYPRFRHRGLMIDESRSFKGKDFLKKQIDAMALLKLNVLHLHLDDSAGWRIESQAYPRLTSETAWRRGYRYIDWEQNRYAFAHEGDPDAYGGYYTREDLKEIVAYAAERFITVIPEIEMPGHSMEVGYAYPEVTCQNPDGTPFRGSWDLCPGSEATFALLEGILTEVMEIFPGPYLHIGGDEATMKTWAGCPKCQARMEAEGYTDIHQLQGYLVRRVEAFVRRHGRRVIGWDEILETGVPEGAVVQSWRGESGGRKASAAGFDVIMSPNTHCYFDYYQDLIRKEPKAVGTLTSLHWCYKYEPVSEGMDPAHVLGLQANLWCEWIPTPEHAEYMLYPRLFAIAERGWSPSDTRDYPSFRSRAQALLTLLKERGYNGFDMENESELARSGFQRFEQLEQYQQEHDHTH